MSKQIEAQIETINRQLKQRGAGLLDEELEWESEEESMRFEQLKIEVQECLDACKTLMGGESYSKLCKGGADLASILQPSRLQSTKKDGGDLSHFP